MSLCEGFRLGLEGDAPIAVRLEQPDPTATGHSGFVPLSLHLVGHVCQAERLGGFNAFAAYATNYGETAALDAHGGQKCISVREDWVEQLVLGFFEERIFGPMRLDKLASQLRAHDRDQRRDGKLASTRTRRQIGELDRKIKAQVHALEKGVEPELVAERIAELRSEKEELEDALAGIGAERQEAETRSSPSSLPAFPI